MKKVHSRAKPETLNAGGLARAISPTWRVMRT